MGGETFGSFSPRGYKKPRWDAEWRESRSVSCRRELVSWLVVKLTSGGGSTGRSPAEPGVVGASGSIGAWGSGQTALIRSGDAEE